MSDKNKILITTSIMLSLLGTGYVSLVPARPVMAQSVEMVAANEKAADKIYETKNWKKIEEKWSGMCKLIVPNLKDIPELVGEQQKIMATLFEPLIKGGYLSSVSAEAINLVYGENLRISLQKTAMVPSCYSPMPISEWDCTALDSREELQKKLDLLEETYKGGTINKEVYESARKNIEDRIALVDNPLKVDGYEEMSLSEWDCTGIDTREELVKQSDLLEEYYKKGSIKKEVYTFVRKDINNRLELLEHADKYWQAEGEGKCEEHPEEVDIILHLYDQDVGGIKEGKYVYKDLFKASEYVLKLEH